MFVKRPAVRALDVLGASRAQRAPQIPALPQPVAAPPVPALPPAVLPRPARAEPGLRPESLAGPVRPVSTKISPRASTVGVVFLKAALLTTPPSVLTLGGSLLAQYPTAWRAQGGLAKELAAVLDQVRESHPVIARPSLSRVDDLVQRYDLGTELARFHLRVDEVIATLHAELPRDLLRGQLDALSESAWWLLQAYSREELRTVPVAGTALVAPLESKASEGEDDSDSADEVVLGPQSPKLADQSAECAHPHSRVFFFVCFLLCTAPRRRTLSRSWPKQSRAISAPPTCWKHWRVV